MLAAEQALARGDKTAAARLARQAAASASRFARKPVRTGLGPSARRPIRPRPSRSSNKPSRPTQTGGRPAAILAETCDKLENGPRRAEYRRAAELAPRESEPIERLVDTLDPPRPSGRGGAALAESCGESPTTFSFRSRWGTRSATQARRRGPGGAQSRDRARL